MEAKKAEETKVMEEYQQLNNQHVKVKMLYYEIAEEKRQHEYHYLIL